MKIPRLPMLTWLQNYRLQELLRESFWFWPFLVVLATLFVINPGVRWLASLGYDIPFFWPIMESEMAKVVLTGLSATMLTFLVFILSSLLMVVQLASGQLTPRIMSFAFSDAQARMMTCMLLFSFLFSTSILAQVTAGAKAGLGVRLSVISVLVSIILFLRFVAHMSMSLRPIALMRLIAEEGHEAIASVYPNSYERAATEKAGSVPRKLLRKEAHVVAYEGPSGVLQSFGATDLVRAAEAADCTVELLAQVGNFVSNGDPLFRTFPPAHPIDTARLHQMVAIGPERTLDKDPVFAFRIIVDIASRALSPAVNDPTTAVLAIDQLERLLRFVGTRSLDPGMLYDSKDNLRLIFPVPNWEDYVSLAASEIRLYGANSIQVPRRLMAMLEFLIEVLPAPRAAALRAEMSLLGKAVKREFLDAADRERMTTGDRQGVGGTTE